MAKVVQVRREYFDRVKRDFVVLEEVTERIKAARQVTGAHSATAMYRRTIGPGSSGVPTGSALRITFQAFGRRGGTPLGAAGRFFMIDREGTFDHPYLEADGREVVTGDELNPIHEVRGSFRVFVGSAAGGTFWFAYDGIIHRGGTETVSP